MSENETTRVREVMQPAFVMVDGLSTVGEALRMMRSAGATAFMPRKQPYAVYGEGSPEEPVSRGRPVTWVVSVRTMTQSSTLVPTSSAVV